MMSSASSRRRKDGPAEILQEQGRRGAVPEALTSTRIMAIVRTQRTTMIPDVVEVLVGAGVLVVEIALGPPDALGAIHAVARRQLPHLLLGAGTVLDAPNAVAALKAGARYLVSPAVIPEVIDVALASAVPVFPGAYTATEILTAARAGATAVKVFPASLGGPHYIASLREPLAGVPLMPTGGVTLDQIGPYLRSGAVAVAIGSPLIGDAFTTADLTDLAERARAALDAAKRASEP